MRVPKVGETIIYRDSLGKAHTVSVLYADNSEITFKSPRYGGNAYVDTSWQGDAEVGWDFIDPEEDPLDVIRKRLDALEAATGPIPKICQDYENTIRRLRTGDRCLECGHEDSTQDNDIEGFYYIRICGFGACHCREPFHAEKTARLEQEQEGNIS